MRNCIALWLVALALTAATASAETIVFDDALGTGWSLPWYTGTQTTNVHSGTTALDTSNGQVVGNHAGFTVGTDVWLDCYVNTSDANGSDVLFQLSYHDTSEAADKNIPFDNRNAATDPREYYLDDVELNPTADGVALDTDPGTWQHLEILLTQKTYTGWPHIEHEFDPAADLVKGLILRGSTNLLGDDILLVSPGAPPPFSTWVVNGSEDWNVAANWSPAALPGPGRAALLGGAITSDVTVYTDTVATVKGIEFDNANTYRVAGEAVNLQSDTALSTLTVTAGSHEFQAPVSLANDAAVLSATGAALAFNNALNLNGHTLTLSGAGDVNVNNVLNAGGGSVVVAGGALGGGGTIGGDLLNSGGSVAPGNSAGILTVDGDFTQTAGGTLDIEVGGLVAGVSHDRLAVTGTANLAGTLAVQNIGGFVPRVRDQVSILTAAEVNGAFDTATGLDDLGGKAGLDWEVSYAADTVTLTATAHPGDATLDAKVDVFDLAALANHYNLPGAWGHEEADFTGDGSVTVFDLAALANNYGWTEGGSPVPEPATMALLAIGGLALIRRKR